MNASPDADRNEAEKQIALAIMKAINASTALACSIPRIRDGVVTMEAANLEGLETEFTILISRNDRVQS